MQRYEGTAREQPLVGGWEFRRRLYKASTIVRESHSRNGQRTGNSTLDPPVRIVFSRQQPTSQIFGKEPSPNSIRVLNKRCEQKRVGKMIFLFARII